MAYEEQYQPIQPPEIRHPQEKLSQHDFYVTFDGRADIEVLKLISDWVKEQPPSTPVAILFSYLPETEEEPALLEASLILGAPIDVG